MRSQFIPIIPPFSFKICQDLGINSIVEISKIKKDLFGLPYIYTRYTISEKPVVSTISIRRNYPIRSLVLSFYFLFTTT